MDSLGVVMIVLGVLLAGLAAVLPTTRMVAVTPKSKWIVEVFGKAGLRVFYVLLGSAFALLGYSFFVG
ncbi:hypothetical protein ACFL6C_04070 [Myxococcota bacterium]